MGGGLDSIGALHGVLSGDGHFRAFRDHLDQTTMHSNFHEIAAISMSLEL